MLRRPRAKARRCLLLTLALLVALPIEAQRGRRAVQSALPIEETLAKAEAHYRAYEVAEGLALLERLETSLQRSRKPLPEAFAPLRERLERAERLLPHTERVELIERLSVPVSKLRETLEERLPRLARVISLEIEGGRLVGSSYRSPLGNAYLIGRQEAGEAEESRVRSAEFAEEIQDGEDIGLSGANFPYLMPDGITLVFGKRSPKGLGGYDLYMSRYNWERGVYLEPSLLGMPYSSPDNDYLLAYDDELDLSLLVTDRGCEAGEVALYLIKGSALALGSKARTTNPLTLEEAIPLARLETTTTNTN